MDLSKKRITICNSERVNTNHQKTVREIALFVGEQARLGKDLQQ